MIIQVFAIFLAVSFFSIVLKSPRKFIPIGGFVGAICYWIYLVTENRTGSIAIASFVAALMIAFVSHVFARTLKAPVTVFFIPGMLPLVPGGQIYSSVYALLHHDKASAYEYFMLTLQIAGVIALAIFIMDTIFQMTAGGRFGKIRAGHFLSRKKTD